ncbi:aldo/keto reductase family protein [Dictyobacter arantiisoli]|uniref:Voltage-gated potassium channel n=1 Tax=Dictyobacter arantiisoli TaxID=2014874 RepID=A0A5A5T5A3_9CHLR|nr:aldo/keto reductase family protein [Dictyobacter arantiisoli]GCF06458.1 voltage-gated potassium channel [Dictyobacter arantiisoli]
MEYRHLGRAGVKVSTISLGSWLTYGMSTDKQVAIDCIHRAYDLGVNFFDTANVYNRGEAEKVVGSALSAYSRDSYVLATKVYFPMGEGPNDRGLSRKHIIEQCNASLKRLGVDYIDLYQCHRYDPETPIDEVLRAFDDLIRQGKILYAGVSEWSAVNIADAVYTARELNLDKIVSNQPAYNLLHRRIEKDIIPLCEREGIGQIVFSPLAQGVLTGKYKPGQQPAADTRAANAEINGFMGETLSDKTLSAVQELQKLAEEGGYKVSQLALAWILRQKNVSSAIIGASRPSQVEENVSAADIKLSDNDLERIDTILEGVVGY